MPAEKRTSVEISNADLVEKYFESDRANEEIIATYNTIDEAREAMKVL